MKTALRRVMPALVAIAVVAALAWLFIEKRAEREQEGERERPAAAEARSGRSPAGESTVTLDRAAQQQLGLRDTVLLLRAASPEFRAYGQVVDPSSLVTLDGDLSVAEATAEASNAMFKRARTLRQSKLSSPADYDAAEARYRGDESRRRQAEQQMAAEWGDWISTQPPADRHALIERIAERRTALARVSLPAGETAKPQADTARIEVLGHEQHPLRPKRVLDAPSTDPRTPGPTFLLLFDPAGFSVRPGDAVTVFFSGTGSSVPGVVIPRDAAVRYGGKVWVFVRASPEQFIRREISTEEPTTDGWLVRSGFTPGETLVVVGAQALLSEQFKSQIQIEEDGGEEKEPEEKDRR